MLISLEPEALERQLTTEDLYALYPGGEFQTATDFVSYIRGRLTMRRVNKARSGGVGQSCELFTGPDRTEERCAVRWSHFTSPCSDQVHPRFDRCTWKKLNLDESVHGPFLQDTLAGIRLNWPHGTEAELALWSSQRMRTRARTPRPQHLVSQSST